MKYLSRFIAMLMSAALLLTPCAFAAGNDEDVLSAISHSDTDIGGAALSGRDINFNVPNSYSGTVSLSGTLTFSYDTAKYEYATIVSFKRDSKIVTTLTVEDTVAVDMEVQYRVIGDPDNTYSTTYKLYVARKANVPAVFAGSIDKTIIYPEETVIKFSSSDFTSLYTANDGGALTYIQIIGQSTTVGSLNYSSGANITAANLGNITFTAKAGGTITYQVYAYNSKGQVNNNPVALTIKVDSIGLPTITDSLGKTAKAGDTVTFTAANFTSKATIPGVFNSIKIVPSTASSSTKIGKWYYNGVNFTGERTITAANINLLTFVASAEGVASFDWYVSNELGFSAAKSDSISVGEGSLKPTNYSSSASIINGGTWTFARSHFAYTPTTDTIYYIKITTIPSASDGYLYLTTALTADTTAGYPAIAKDTALKAGAIIPVNYIQYMRMSTKNTSTNKTITFKWTVTKDSVLTSTSWAADTATYTLNIGSPTAISYTSDLNMPATFSATDFSNVFRTASGETLSYVTFTLPTATTGKLYYEYDATTAKGTSVSASTKYYASASPYISYVSFVPATGYTGTATITYKAYAASGNSTTGTVSVSVTNTAGGTFSYSTDKDSPVLFDAKDFISSFKSATDKTLSYVRFTLPTSSQGTLYYNYDLNGNYDYAISSSSRFYAYSADYLSYVSFVPKSGYTGTVSISFTGYSSDGYSYSGKVIVNVVDSPGGVVHYYSGVNVPVKLSANDFADEFISSTGSVLSYVTFKLPTASEGVLYTDYNTYDKTGTKVSASTKYYNSSSPSISSITYAPADGYTGVVTISFTAYSVSGTSYTGKLIMTTGELTAGTVTLTTARNTAVSLSGSSFSTAFARQAGKTLSYVRFSIPSASYGRLYQDYKSSSNTGTSVSSTTNYYVTSTPLISTLTFVPQTGFSGTVTVNYTGYTSSGEYYDGKLKIIVGTSTSYIYYSVESGDVVFFDEDDFNDVFITQTGSTLHYVNFTLPSSSAGRLHYNYVDKNSTGSYVSAGTNYYRTSSPRISNVSFVPASGYSGTVTIGYTAYSSGGTKYSGSIYISVNITDTVTEPVFTDLSGYSWAEDAIEYLYSKGVVNGTGSGRFSPQSDITRGDFIVMLYRGFGFSGSRTSSFDDVQSGLYYYDAIAAAESLGIAQGDGKSFRPNGTLSRQDAMVLVYRTLDVMGKAPSSGSGRLSSFSDGGQVADYAVAAVESLIKAGVIEGSNGRIYPNSSITRAEMSVILYRVLML